MQNYPNTQAEMEQMFENEEACRKRIAEERWQGGFVCGACGGTLGWEMGNGRILCRSCRHQQSVLAGTIFQDTHLPLKTWFRAMWLVCASKNGMSAQNLQRLLGLRSYNTAWLCLHKLRRAMVRPGRERLSGTVEADETYIGGPSEGKRGRGAFGKRIVVVIAERRGEAIGRIRLAEVPNVRSESLKPVVLDYVEPGSTVVTDGWTGYNFLQSEGYGRINEVRDESELASVVLPRCHLVVSLVKRWILGTLQGSIGVDHLQDYLNEFTFRFNRRASRSRGLLFQRLLELTVQTAPNTRNSIIPPHLVGGWLSQLHTQQKKYFNVV